MHEDLLDYSILLTPLPSNPELQDTRFGIEHTKLRDHVPELRRKYEGSIWTTKEESLMFEFAPAGFRASDHEIEMLRLRNEGQTLEEIGRKFGVNRSTVHRALKKIHAQSTDDTAGE
jgi:putative DNA primase/helicase